MSRDFRLYLDDILEACARIKSYSTGLSFDEFVSDRKTIDAVIINLHIIGEAVKNLPTDALELRPEIEWKKVARLRDLIAHYYFKINYEVVWSILQNDIERLEQAAKEILTQLDNDEVED